MGERLVQGRMFVQQAIPHRALDQIDHQLDLNLRGDLSALDASRQDIAQGVAPAVDENLTQGHSKFDIQECFRHQAAHDLTGFTV
jgi:hypothetical protein